MQYPRLAAACLAAAFVAACGGGGGDPAPLPVATHVHLQSDPGDVMGQGGTYDYTPANAQIRMSANGRLVGLEINGNERWLGVFELSEGTLFLDEGNYSLTPSSRFGIANGSGGWARACPGATEGAMFVDSVSYIGPTLSAISMSFELRCAGSVPGLRGTVDWRLGD